MKTFITMMVSFLISSSILVLIVPAHAVIINNGNFTTDTDTGLDWLDLSETAGLTANEALAANTGWSLANSQQFNSMFSNFFNINDFLLGATSDTVDWSDTIYGYATYEGDDASFANNTFMDLFGSSGGYTYHHGGFGDVTITYSYGWYSNTAYSNAQHGGLNTLSYTTGAQDRITSQYEGYGLFDMDAKNEYYGTFLIRSNAPVPEPTSLALLGLGLACFGFSRRKKKF